MSWKFEFLSFVYLLSHPEVYSVHELLEGGGAVEKKRSITKYKPGVTASLYPHPSGLPSMSFCFPVPGRPAEPTCIQYLTLVTACDGPGSM